MMRISFHIHYYTVPGQTMCLSGTVPLSGADGATVVLPMEWQGDGRWQLHIELDTPAVFRYGYLLRDGDGTAIAEPRQSLRTATIDGRHTAYRFVDSWTLPATDRVYSSSAFTDCIYPHPSQTDRPYYPRELTVRTRHPRLPAGHKLGIVGNQSCLGNWNQADAHEMHCTGSAEWAATLDADALTYPVEYKFVVLDDEGRLLRWEQGENRRFEGCEQPDEAAVVVTADECRDPQAAWRGAGTVIPLFALRSEQSCGTGDLHDLRLLVDWAAQTGQRLIQLLPVNDTTRTHTRADSYPYSAISVYALHPMYIALADLPPLSDADRMAAYEAERRQLNAYESVDYEEVERVKTAYLRDWFAQEGGRILASADFHRFRRQNDSWLLPYAAFRYYCDRYGTADFSRWGDDAHYHPDGVARLCDTDHEAAAEMSYTFVVQYLLHTQFAAAAAYARRHGVILKGDLPIGVNRHGVEAWTDPQLFNLTQQAGAPPDDFSAGGQNWSFPTYNWEQMQRDGYRWWRRRLSHMEQYFDAFRIDHILGFFRIWEIPTDRVEAIGGHFRPALPLTADDIRQAGIAFDRQLTAAQIHPDDLAELVGVENVSAIAGEYLEPTEGGYLRLRAPYATQRLIEQHLDRQPADASADTLRRALFTIADELLFLPDPYTPDRYHPRIAAAGSYRYRRLTADRQAAFDRLSQSFFYERHDELWKRTALSRLAPLVAATRMMVCGEDLGMIPRPVHEVMERLGILSLELERTPKSFGLRYTDLDRLPALSVCTTSTHDMTPLRNWWTDEADRSDYFCNVLHRSDLPPADCTPSLAATIIDRHLCAAAMWVVVPLQDWLAADADLRRPDPSTERINIPADPHHYWRYRMHLTLEQLLAANDFNRTLRRQIADSNRLH